MTADPTLIAPTAELPTKRLGIELLFLDLTTCTAAWARTPASRPRWTRSATCSTPPASKSRSNKILVELGRAGAGVALRELAHDPRRRPRRRARAARELVRLRGVHRRLRRSHRLPRLGLPRPGVHRAAGRDDRRGDPQHASTATRRGRRAASRQAYELPENLARFFAGKAAAAESACCEPPSRRPAARPRPRRTAAAPNTSGMRVPVSAPRLRRAARRRRGMGRAARTVAGVHRAPHAGSDTAEDILQDVLLRIHRHADELDTLRRCARGSFRSRATRSPITTAARRCDENSPPASTSPARATASDRVRSGRAAERARGLPAAAGAAAPGALP